jgi:hypothetical protein
MLPMAIATGTVIAHQRKIYLRVERCAESDFLNISLHANKMNYLGRRHQLCSGSNRQNTIACSVFIQICN